MQPLSPAVRRFYLVLFIALFFAILPVVIFFADGWRYKTGYGFVRTGGIYIGVPYPDAEVSINDTHLGRSGFIDRNFYLGDLAPASYTVHVEKEGYRPWTRQLIVEEQLVTDAQALLLPIEIAPRQLIVATSSASADTATLKVVPRATITEYTTIFAATTTASSTLPLDEQDGTGLFIDRGILLARWLKEDAFPPSPFCENPTSCADTITLDNTTTITDALFYRGGAVYVTSAGEVHFLEIDIRSAPIHLLFFAGTNPKIRVIDGSLIIKDGTAYYEISL